MSAPSLLVVGHGIEGGPGVLDDHVATIRERGLYAAAVAAVLRGEPDVAAAAAGLAAGAVVVVPYLMSDGYTAREVLPGALEGLAGRAFAVAPPVGTAATLTDLLAVKAMRAARKADWPAREVAVLVVAHGTARDGLSAAAARDHARALGLRKRFAATASAYLDQAPAIEAQLAEWHGRAVVAVGLFADEGPHGRRDVEAQLDVPGARTLYAGAVGVEPAMVDVILGRAAEAAAAL